MSTVTRFLRGSVTTLTILLLAAGTAQAQYFGSNKVQYKHLQFEVLKTEHFDIYYYPSEHEGVDLAARLAERWYVRLSRIFDHELSGRQPLVLYASHADFEQTTVIEGEIGQGTGGVTEPDKRRIVLPLAESLTETDHVIGHELVHAFQFDITARPDSLPGSRLAPLPLWFVEGMAEYLSLGASDTMTSMWVRDAVRRGALPSLKTLDRDEYFPYRWGQAFWAYVAGRWGDGVITSMLSNAAAGDVASAITHVLGLTDREFSGEWQAASISRYIFPLVYMTPPSVAGRILIGGNGQFGNEINVSPAVSPDGRWVAFLSGQTLFSIDLLIADATSGRVVRTLTHTATDPHYSNLQFIASTAAWDASSRRVAIATVADGHAVLAIFDALSGVKERDVRIDTVDEIFHPTWSPDGHTLAFTAMVGGLTDLFTYDLSNGSLRRVTQDPYAELHPAWSPDGRAIVFATDRFSTDLDTLAFGRFQLARLEVETGRMEPLSPFANGNQIDPAWSSDGTRIYFLSDNDGVPNLYRLTLATGESEQMTAIATGLAGITALSPAMSVTSATDEAFVSVFEEGRYQINVLNLPDVARISGRRSGDAVLPPTERRGSDVAELLIDASIGLPPRKRYEVAKYRPSLSLNQIGQQSVGIGINRFGTEINAGVALSFSDFLNTRTLFTGGQFSSLRGTTSFNDIAAQIGYANRASRWEWALVGGQIPYVSGRYETADGAYEERPADFQSISLYRQTERAVSAVAAYPLNRARRIELQGTLSRMTLERIVIQDVYAWETDELLSSETTLTPLGGALALASPSAAFVSDTASYGAASPVYGERYRIEASPSVGTTHFTTLLADYRRYFMPVRFYTIATRVLHYARYGAGAEDPRMVPLYLGSPSLVRGYAINSLNPLECTQTSTSQCAEFDALMGSRMLVGNVELRLPLLRPFGLSRRMYGPLPIELGVFADAGVAWRQGETPTIFGGRRSGVASIGTVARFNLMGAGVWEIDVVRPLQRPNEGFVFQFSVSPGF